MIKPDLIESIREDCEKVVTDVSSLRALQGECVLITGGTGFMGTWLAEMFAFLNDQHGCAVRVILMSSQANKFRSKAPHLADRPDVTLCQQDVRNFLDLPEEVNWIIHAAGNPDNRQHSSDPLRVMQVITQGTACVLEAATRLPNLKKFLNISSALACGPQPWDMAGIPENQMFGLDCSAVGAAYPEAKRYAETLCAAYRNQHRLPIVNARPFAFIGPYQHLNRPWAVNNFIRDGLQGSAIRIQGDGQTVRSYMYGSDMAWWLLNILVRGGVGINFNVGSPDGVTLAQVADKVASNFPVRPKVLLSVSADRNLRRSKLVPDVSLAQKSLGLECAVDLDTGIQRTIAWNQARLNKEAVEV